MFSSQRRYAGVEIVFRPRGAMIGMNFSMAFKFGIVGVCIHGHNVWWLFFRIYEVRFIMTTVCSRLQQELEEARSRTDSLFALIRPEAMYARPIPERHRVIFI